LSKAVSEVFTRPAPIFFSRRVVTFGKSAKDIRLHEARRGSEKKALTDDFHQVFFGNSFAVEMAASSEAVGFWWNWLLRLDGRRSGQRNCTSIADANWLE
jgi:hypothetical protein